jgi:polyisoprenyl-phosphate glycosyltransferase
MVQASEKLISIIIPCYNEEGNITIIYQKIKEVLFSYQIEFVFIDDHSTDATIDEIEKLAANDSTVKFVSFSRNFGHQNALRAGFEYATGDCVISMDADLQHPPEILTSLIEKWQEGYEVVYTTRKDIKNTSFFKKYSSRLFYRLINSLSDVEIRQGSADFRLLDKQLVKIFVNDITEYHLFYRGLVSWVGYKQTGIEYVPNRRYSGKTKYSLMKMLSFAADGITSFSIKPLKIAILFGILITILSAIYGVYVIAMAIFTNETVRGWSSVLTSILFIGGVNIVLLGIIGQYVGKLYIQSKNRPQFLVEKTNITLEQP